MKFNCHVHGNTDQVEPCCIEATTAFTMKFWEFQRTRIPLTRGGIFEWSEGDYGDEGCGGLLYGTSRSGQYWVVDDSENVDTTLDLEAKPYVFPIYNECHEAKTLEEMDRIVYECMCQHMGITPDYHESPHIIITRIKNTLDLNSYYGFNTTCVLASDFTEDELVILDEMMQRINNKRIKK